MALKSDLPSGGWFLKHDQAKDYAKTVRDHLFTQGIRAEIDSGNDRLAKQIRNAEQQRVPIMGVIGAKVS